MKDKSKITAIVLSIIAIIILIVTYFFNNKTEEEKVNNKINIVTNYSEFYTVESCLNRTISHIYLGDSESLMLLLDDNYKITNKVTKENILNFFETIEDDSSFIAKKMYYKKINSNITKYYVYGNIILNQTFIEDDIIDDESSIGYFIVYLDSVSKTFSVEPYSGQLFKEGDING